MYSPKVTVLMPVYNGESFLSQAIDSVLAQSFKDFEFLILNDGSTDSSSTIIKSYNDQRIRLVNNTVNKGLIETLNSGIELAKGEYIARFDCDDRCHFDRLEKQVQFLDAHLEVGICGSWVRPIGAASSLWRFPEEHEQICCKLLFNSPLAHPSIMLRRNIFEKFNLRYDLSFPHAEDYKLWVDASTVTRLFNIPEPLIEYRIHPDQIGQIHSSGQSEASIRIRHLQFQKLGIDLSKDTLALVGRLGTLLGCQSYADLRVVENVLIDVLVANKRENIYDQAVLKAEIETLWRELIVVSCYLGPFTFVNYFRSPLRTGTILSDLKVLVKCLRGYLRGQS